MSNCDCGDNPTDDLISIKDAKKILFDNASLIDDSEIVSIKNTTGRILSESLIAKISVPSFDNSAMDGFAFAFDGITDNNKKIPISNRIPAGKNPAKLDPNTVARIFTGACIPEGADTVIKQESCQYDNDNLIIKDMPKKCANVRYAGEDFKEQDVLIKQGAIIKPQDQGIAASTGNSNLKVKRKIKIAIFSTGDELLDLDEKISHGKIYDSNRYTLMGLLDNPAIEVIDLGKIKDDYNETKNTLIQAAKICDLILTSGGVSVGEEDYIKQAIMDNGKLNLWRIKIRPGKPLAFGRINNTPIIGIPGNPVSLFITFLIFVKPYIFHSLGATDFKQRSYKIPATFACHKLDKREEYIRARAVINNKGILELHSFNTRSSGVLTSTTWADGLAKIPPNQTHTINDLVDFMPFYGIL
ncbi:MAG: molybdopterin molybdenumtransferase MoeA [Gammaproteobacteria bacterium]|nr:MAG: molybdopterin molybdenumtransferase MoeA [Gammaproteobacteria bacterium]